MENEELKTIASEEQINDLVTKVIGKVIEKTKDHLTDGLYNTVNSYLYEHHDNFKRQIYDEVFKHICGSQWNKFKDTYESSKMRAELYKIHKAEIDGQLTEQVVEEEIKRYFGIFLNDEHKTGWRYRDLEKVIADWIYKNLHTPKMAELIENKLVQENKNLKYTVSNLEERLREIEEIAN